VYALEGGLVMEAEFVFVAGEWRKAASAGTFRATNPGTGDALENEYPISAWTDIDDVLNAAVKAAIELRHAPVEKIAVFLEAYASEIESNAEAIVQMAHLETGLPVSPRLRDVELPRTTTQLRQGAAAAREGSWTRAVIDTKNNIRSHFAPVGPVVVFGPNNFPFAFNGVSGGDLTAAIAAGNPVLAKGHPLHPGTTQLLAKCAAEALKTSGLPMASVQMLYHIANEDGLRLVADPRVGASSFTGSRGGGLRLKEAADKAGRPIYLEMSSLNPIVILPGAIRERSEQLATELADSALAASGQFCTSPNIVFAIGEKDAEDLADRLEAIYAIRTPSVLLSHGGLQGLDQNVQALIKAGAKVRVGATPHEGPDCRYNNTLLQVSGSVFLASGEALQIEAFGNAFLLVTVKDIAELKSALASLEGNLTGCIYSSTTGTDDAIYTEVAEILRFKVGRLLNDKMPTGVALSPAMNHGGPFPATGHPGFTAVGIPASMMRFGSLHCYDNVREARLPPALKNKAPNAATWRSIDGVMRQGDVPATS
jgi:alpha-ketoglutaric semialdehyde dehydrogenase